MSETLPHIAIVDDEPALRRSVAAYLARRGCRVSDLPNGAALRELMRREPVDLVVLDDDLPGEDGFSTTRWLRTRSRVGIVRLADGDRAPNRATHAEPEADDVVRKPFEPRELLARVRVLLRRLGHAASLETVPAPLAEDFADTAIGRALPVPTVVRIGRCRLDASTGEVWDRDGRPLALTDNEREVLARLMEQPHEPVSADDLLMAMPEPALESLDDTVGECIARLRDIIEPHPSRPQSIRRSNGGYVYTPNEALQREALHSTY